MLDETAFTIVEARPKALGDRNAGALGVELNYW
jgi:hypothetical protein